MQRVGALIRHVSILGAQPPRRFLAVLAALHLPRDRPLQALDLLQTPLQVAWVLLYMTVRERGQLLDAQVHPHYRPGVLPDHVLLVDEHGDMPVSGLLGDGGREDFGVCGQVATLLEPQSPQARQLDGIRENDQRASEAKAAQPALLALARGIAELAAQLALLLERGAAEELGEGAVQVAQSFLRCALGHRVHPGNLGLLERVEFPVEINGRWTLAGRAVRILLALQAPVECPTRRPGMLLTGGDLLVIQIQLGLVGALDGAHAWSASAASAASAPRSRHCLTHA